MRVMAKRAKESRTYRVSSENYVEILGNNQRSGAPKILQSTTLSRPTKRSVAASSTRSHRYNYRDDSNSEDGDKDFVASPLSDNYDEDLSYVEVVEKFNPKIQRIRVGTARGSGSATTASSAKRTYVRSANKH